MRATRPVRRGAPPPQPTAPRASAVKLPSPSGGPFCPYESFTDAERGHDLRPEDWRDSPSPFSPALDLRPPDTPRRPGRGHRLPHARGGTGAVRELRPADHRRLVQGRSRRQGLSAPLLRRRARASCRTTSAPTRTRRRRSSARCSRRSRREHPSTATATPVEARPRRRRRRRTAATTIRPPTRRRATRRRRRQRRPPTAAVARATPRRSATSPRARARCRCP